MSHIARSHRAPRRFAAVTLAATLAVAACSGSPSGSAPASSAGAVETGAVPPSPAAVVEVPALQDVTLDGERISRAVIGPDGGALQATDDHGSTYELTVPPGALPVDTELAAIPFTAVAGLPAELSTIAGVHLLPEGLHFASLVDLTITLADEPSGAFVPFAYDGDLEEPQRYPAAIDGRSATFGIVHFSGYGLLQATSQATAAAELGLLIPWAPPPGPADLALTSIAAALGGETIVSPAEQANGAMRTWLQHLRTQVAAFRQLGAWSEPFFEASQDVGDAFELWAYVEKLLVLNGLPLDPSLASQVPPLVDAAAAHGIAVPNTSCASASTASLLIVRLPVVLGWVERAGNLGTGSDPSLEHDAVLDRLCVQVAYDPNGGTDFPTGIQAGQAGTLNVHVGISVDGGEPRFDTAFDIVVTPHGAEPDTVVEQQTGADGRFTRQFLWDPVASQLRLDISACVVNVPLCQDAFVVRGTGPTSPPAGPGGPCPLYMVALDGVAHPATSPDGITVTGDKGSGSALGTKTLLLNAFDGGTTAGTIAVRYTVDALQASGGPFEITVAFYGRVQDASGGMGTVTLTVGEETRSFTSPQTDINGADVGPGTLEIPITVTHGQVVLIEVLAKARSTGGRTTLTGGIQLLNRPEQVVFAHPDCG